MFPKLPGHIHLDVKNSHTAFTPTPTRVNQVSDISMEFLTGGKQSLVKRPSREVLSSPSQEAKDGDI